MVTYNLTIDQLHTYYVEAANIPVLVHNCGGDNLDALSASADSGKALNGNTLSRAGRSYQMHMGRGELDPVANDALNSTGQSLVDEILANPNTIRQDVISGRQAGGVRFIGSDGIGITFDSSGVFQYFGRY
jgi:hypothetical protein